MTRDAEKLTVVQLRGLPYEVAGYDVYDFFSAYGEVLTMDRTVSSDYPSLCDENRIVEIVLKESLPCVLTGCGVESRIWYREQPPQCFVCREPGHRVQACPLSGLCRHCRRPGYKARECSRVWDPAAAAASGDSMTSVSAYLVSVYVASVPFSAMIDPVSITVDEPLAVDSVPANVASVPPSVVVVPAPIIVDRPLYPLMRLFQILSLLQSLCLVLLMFLLLILIFLYTIFRTAHRWLSWMSIGLLHGRS